MSEWRNWAGDQACSPAVVERPSSLEDIASAVVAGAGRDHVVRAVGAGHSFGDIEHAAPALERDRFGNAGQG
jgi:L-gulonolactone oxidase